MCGFEVTKVRGFAVIQKVNMAYCAMVSHHVVTN